VRFKTMLAWFLPYVGQWHRCGCYDTPAFTLIMARLTGIRTTLERLAGRLVAGTFKPRRSFTRKPSETRKPTAPNRLRQKFGWMLKLVPEAPAFAGAVRDLLADQATAALIEAAPDQMRRPLRSLCWMFAVVPPPILARPKAPPKPKALPKPKTAAARKQPLVLPFWLTPPPRRFRLSAPGLRYAPPIPKKA